MDGWMDAWMDGWIDGWMDGQIDRVFVDRQKVCFPRIDPD